MSRRYVNTKTCFLGLVLLGAAACSRSSDDKDTSNLAPVDPLATAQATLDSLNPGVQSALLNAPEIYRFERDGGSTVDYQGQTFRQLLIEDLKAFIGSQSAGGYAGSKEELLKALDGYFTYAYDNSGIDTINGGSTFKYGAKGLDGQSLPIAEGNTYSTIQDPGKNLREKIAGNDNPLLTPSLIGWTSLEGQTLSTIDADGKQDGLIEPEDLVQAWFNILAERAVNGTAFEVNNGSQATQRITEAFVTPEGLDLKELTQKFLLGAIGYSQALGDYLSKDLGADKGLNSQNEKVAKPGVLYTDLEHAWDEAFGYFGAAHDFLAYTDKQIADGLSIDTDADGKISLRKEKNFAAAGYAGKRDLSVQDYDFTQSIMKAFLQGRHLIATKPEGYQAAVPALATIIAGRWEQVNAATVAHYAKRVDQELSEFGTSDYSFKDHAKYWSEMKGFALSFQFNPYSLMDQAKIAKMNELLGDKPVLGSAGATEVAAYRQRLEEARKLIADTYGFSADQMQAW